MCVITSLQIQPSADICDWTISNVWMYFESYCCYYYVCGLNIMSYLPLGWNGTEGADLADRSLWTPSLTMSGLLSGSNKEETDFTRSRTSVLISTSTGKTPPEEEVWNVVWLPSNLHCCLHFVYTVCPKKGNKKVPLPWEKPHSVYFHFFVILWQHRIRATKHLIVSWFSEGWNAAKVLSLLGEENIKQFCMCFAWEHRSNFQRFFNNLFLAEVVQYGRSDPNYLLICLKFSSNLWKGLEKF